MPNGKWPICTGEHCALEYHRLELHQDLDGRNRYWICPYCYTAYSDTEVHSERQVAALQGRDLRG